MATYCKRHGLLIPGQPCAVCRKAKEQAETYADPPNPLYTEAQTQERLGYSLVWEGHRFVWLEFVRRGKFYAVLGYDGASGKKLTAYSGGSYEPRYAADLWFAVSGDWETASEMRRLK